MEDVSDIDETLGDAELLAEVKQHLLACGAKSAHVKRILKAVQKQLGGADAAIRVTGADATRPDVAEWPSHFDRILVDAPCSSERHIMQAPRTPWTPSRLSRDADVQLRLLRAAASRRAGRPARGVCGARVVAVRARVRLVRTGLQPPRPPPPLQAVRLVRLLRVRTEEKRTRRAAVDPRRGGALPRHGVDGRLVDGAGGAYGRRGRRRVRRARADAARGGARAHRDGRRALVARRRRARESDHLGRLL